jgi:putative photosynthetic complex assembly protein
MALTAARPANASRFPLYGAIVLIGFAIIATLFGQKTGIGTVRLEQGEPRAIRDIVLTENSEGLIEVKDARSGDLLASYAGTEGGFVRGALRGLARERMVKSVSATTPYRLILWTSGALTLGDTGTGLNVDLMAFGPTNAGAFARFLDRGSGNL